MSKSIKSLLNKGLTIDLVAYRRLGNQKPNPPGLGTLTAIDILAKKLNVSPRQLRREIYK